MAPARTLDQLSPATLHGLRRGVEKESLRVDANGLLAQTPHPRALGSPLTHPLITTDFSESQLELITGVHSRAEDCASELTSIHAYVHAVLAGGDGDATAGELVWAASMPCALSSDAEIPIGQYGTANSGRLKTLYRKGLAARYGARMQTISGVHYNFSLPESAWAELFGAAASTSARTAAYFGLIRNFRRESWLLLYLFGASPAVCRSFLEGCTHALEPLSESTLYLPHATALRMGGLGYQSAAQASLAVSYNSLATYADSLQHALTKPYPPYAAISLDQQLSTSLLQIENEFYGTIRPKQPVRAGERPLPALRQRGVEYVEVRLLDLDPFSAIGIEATTMRFVDMFLLHCLLAESLPDNDRDRAIIADNQRLVVERGRQPGLLLRRPDGSVETLTAWGNATVAAMAPIAAAMDQGANSHQFADALAAAGAALADPALTPSARVLAAMETHGRSFADFALARSRAHAARFRDQRIDATTLARHQRLAEQSLQEVRRLEAADSVPFETYRRDYLTQDLYTGPRSARQQAR